MTMRVSIVPLVPQHLFKGAVKDECLCCWESLSSHGDKEEVRWISAPGVRGCGRHDRLLEGVPMV